jgi:AcrR family transcriptional regulator
MSPRLHAKPTQQRSRDTLERLVAATRSLLEKKPFEAIGVGEIVQRARSSVGVFYARFGDKDALLDYLDERYAQDMIASLEDFLADANARRQSLASLASDLWRRLVAFHRRDRGLLRALVLRARLRLEPRFVERTQRMNETFPALVDLFLRHRSSMRHPDPERAVPLGLAMVFSALRDRILFSESIQLRDPPDDASFARELTRCFLAYLGVRGALSTEER